MSEPSSEFLLNGTDLRPLPDGALLWPSQDTLIVADLHLEKGSAYARTGQFLPPYDSRASLAMLAATIGREAPRRVICLGDSFHDPDAYSRLPEAERSTLRTLVEKTDWIWIAGNHDPIPPPEVGGRVMEELVSGPLVFRHEADTGSKAGEVSGHFHPKAAIQSRARRHSARCFIEDGKRLILPAYGRYTGGLSVFDPAISSLFPAGFTAHMILKKGVLRVPSKRLLRAA